MVAPSNFTAGGRGVYLNWLGFSNVLHPSAPGMLAVIPNWLWQLRLTTPMSWNYWGSCSNWLKALGRMKSSPSQSLGSTSIWNERFPKAEDVIGSFRGSICIVLLASLGGRILLTMWWRLSGLFMGCKILGFRNGYLSHQVDWAGIVVKTTHYSHPKLDLSQWNRTWISPFFALHGSGKLPKYQLPF